MNHDETTPRQSAAESTAAALETARREQAEAVRRAAMTREEMRDRVRRRLEATDPFSDHLTDAAVDAVWPEVERLTNERDIAARQRNRLAEERDELQAAVENVRTYCRGSQSYCSANRIDPPPWVAAVLDSIDCLAAQPSAKKEGSSSSPGGAA